MFDFKNEVTKRLESNRDNIALLESAGDFMLKSTVPKYSYNFFWLGRPIIQYPQDIVGMQEIIWEVKPDLIIETGVAHGGSLILSASMLFLLDYCESVSKNLEFQATNPKRKVIGIDVDIRKHNRTEIEAHPFANRIELIQGSSTDLETISQVRLAAEAYSKVLVCLDSNHTHEHVLQELNAYSPLVSSGSYCIVFDTIIEALPQNTYPDRPWGPGNSPLSAVRVFLGEHPEFEIDESMDSKLLISVARNGYLRKK